MVVIPVKLDSTVMRGTALTVERDRARSRTPCACPRPAWKHTAHLRARPHDQRRGHRAPAVLDALLPGRAVRDRHTRELARSARAAGSGSRWRPSSRAAAPRKRLRGPRRRGATVSYAYARWPRDSPSRGSSTGASSHPRATTRCREDRGRPTSPTTRRTPPTPWTRPA